MTSLWQRVGPLHAKHITYDVRFGWTRHESTGIAALMWGWVSWPYWLMLLFGAGLGAIQFTLYGLASGLSNDRVQEDRRVGASAVVLIVYSVGAALGPLVSGALIRLGGPGMLYVFSSGCALMLALVLWRLCRR